MLYTIKIDNSDIIKGEGGEDTNTAPAADL